MWIAAFPQFPDSGATSTGPWPRWTFKQYRTQPDRQNTSPSETMEPKVAGRCAGISGYTDLDSYDGSLNDLDSLVIGGGGTNDTMSFKNPDSVRVPNLLVNVDGVPLGKTNSFGRVVWASFISGLHKVEARIGNLFYSAFVDLTHSNRSSSITLGASGEAVESTGVDNSASYAVRWNLRSTNNDRELCCWRRSRDFWNGQWSAR